MRIILLITLTILSYSNGISQDLSKLSSEKLLSELAENGCKCIDSISTYNKPREEVAKEIGKCIDDQTNAYQLGVQLANIDILKLDEKEVDDKKQTTITINVNENSDDYKKYYYEIERYMMNNCASIKEKIASSDVQNNKSISKNKSAYELYSKGLEESENKNYEMAKLFFEKAVKEDPEFVFAWDNLGLIYRKLNNFDMAIESYEKSLEIDPKGIMPLQNIAVAYEYKKKYKKAIAAYEKLAELDKNNPEVYYGIGNIYTTHLNNYEAGLENMCKAYNMYVEQKSPYRTDAEKIINIIYAEMKKQGNEDKFNRILKANNISSEK